MPAEIKCYLLDFWANVRRSWTMIATFLLGVGGVIEAQFQLLKPYLGDGYGKAYFVALVILAAARARTLKP